MNRIKIYLAGREYTICTEETVSYVKQLASALDAKLDEYMRKNDSLSITTAALLVALGLMDDCAKATADKDNLRKQVIEYLEESTRVRSELAILTHENQTLREQNEFLSLKLLAGGEKEDQDGQTTF